MKTGNLEQPCKICKDHKAGKPFKIRANNAVLYETSFVSNCPYCGRFIAENFSPSQGDK